MNKRGLLGALSIGILLLVVSGLCFYFWWGYSDSDKCSTSFGEFFLHSLLFLISIMCLILAISIIYGVFRPVKGCFGEPIPGAFEKEEKKNAKSKHKLSNKK